MLVTYEVEFLIKDATDKTKPFVQQVMAHDSESLDSVFELSRVMLLEQLGSVNNPVFVGITVRNHSPVLTSMAYCRLLFSAQAGVYHG